MKKKHRSKKKRRTSGLQRSFDAPSNALGLPFLLLLAATSVVAFCILMSLSRGGMIAAAAAFLVALAGLWRSLKLQSGISVVLMGAAILVLGLLAVVGQDQIQSRVDQIVSGDADTVDPGNARRAIWTADLAAFEAFPLFGTGVGSHAEVYPTYMTDYAEFANTRFSHAESTYVNLLLEVGIAGVGLLALGLLVLVARLLFGFLRRESAAQKAVIAAVAASVSGGMLHAVADFIWYVPAIVVISIVLAVVGIRGCSRTNEPRGLPMPRIAWLGLTVVCLFAVVRVQPGLAARVAGESNWYSYLRIVFDEQAQEAADEYAYEKDRRTKRANLLTSVLEPEGSRADDSKNFRYAGPDPNDDLPVMMNENRDASEGGSVRTVAYSEPSRLRGTSDSFNHDPREGLDSSSQSADSSVQWNSEPSEPNARRASQLTVAAAENEERDNKLAVTQQKIALLKATVQADPSHVLARLALARQLLELFQILQSAGENPYSLSQIRHTAGSFDAHAEKQEWIHRVFGKNIELAETADVLARESLKDCPLLRDAWLTLVETDFLRDVTHSDHQAVIDQTIMLRQHDPAARFIAGREALLVEDAEAAIDHWQMVFHASEQHRVGILSMVAPQAPAEFFINLFGPNAEELQDMLAVYDVLERPDESAVILRRLTQVIPEEARAIEDDEERLQLLLLAYAASVRLEDLDYAETLLRSLIGEFPTAYKPRHFLGLVLLQQERFDEALPEFEWCYDRDPGNSWLPRLIVRCRKASLEAAIVDEDELRRREFMLQLRQQQVP